MADKKMSKEEIIEGFNRLRQEQRAIATKIAELEADKSEHGLVLEALSEVDKDRQCFRLIGDVLVERKVGDVLPALEKNRMQITAATKHLNEKLAEKGKTLNQYRTKHNITVRGENTAGGGDVPKPDESSKAGQSSGVLVST